MSEQKKPTLLVILDGYGIAPPSKNNAISLAKKPNIDRLFELYPNTTLGATGKDVGLEENQMSGSESGHMNIGAGRIVQQDSFLITKSIRDGSFYMDPALKGAVNHAKKYGGNFHVMGLMGDSDSPHSNPEHFRAILKMAKENGIDQVYCHFFTDGRDSYPRSALKIHLPRFEKIIQKEGIGKIASLAGRFYAMDRTKNWKRLAKAYDAIVFGRGERADSPGEAIEKAYQSGLTDEYLLPTVILEKGEPVGTLRPNDSIVFYNLRSDRARQFSKLFVAMNKSAIITDDMPVIDKLGNLYFVAMTDFGPDLDVHTIFESEKLNATLPMALGRKKQLYIAESEKFAHITYFINGGYADPVDNEDRVMIPSPAVDSYAKTPEMSANLITARVLEHMKRGDYDFYAMNFANADMVGHTGDLGATIKAVESLDVQIGILANATMKIGGGLIITADHGNADDMFDEEVGEVNTFHTKNPVPFVLVSEKFRGKKIASQGVLGNIAPTILDILETEKPGLMERSSLLI